MFKPKKKTSLGARLSGQRKAVGGSAADLVKMKPLIEGGNLPLLIEPQVDGLQLTTWVQSNLKELHEKLGIHGGLLFRGFNVTRAEEFETFIHAFSTGPPLKYRDSSSPRSPVSGNIYTSTDYPPHTAIRLHSESSYSHVWPMKLFFFCHTSPDQGGQTPIADIRQVFNRIPEPIRNRLQEKKIMYTRSFGEGYGLTWQNAYKTDNRQELEAFLKDADISFQWHGPEVLRTQQIRSAWQQHPLTGETVWFNHACFFHHSSLDDGIRGQMLEQLGEDALPFNARYGDGDPFEPNTITLLREAYDAEMVSFPWEQGDVLALDNMLTAHGRAPFIGNRKILVGMTEPYDGGSL